VLSVSGPPRRRARRGGGHARPWASRPRDPARLRGGRTARRPLRLPTNTRTMRFARRSSSSKVLKSRAEIAGRCAHFDGRSSATSRTCPAPPQQLGEHLANISTGTAGNVSERAKRTTPISTGLFCPFTPPAPAAYLRRLASTRRGSQLSRMVDGPSARSASITTCIHRTTRHAWSERLWASFANSRYSLSSSPRHSIMINARSPTLSSGWRPLGQSRYRSQAPGFRSRSPLVTAELDGRRLPRVRNPAPRRGG
jgi:hypothetical protein